MNEEKKALFIEQFYGNGDLVVRPVITPYIGACFFYLDGMVDEERLSREIVTPLLTAKEPVPEEFESFLSVVRFTGNVESCADLEKAVQTVAAGDAALLLKDTFFLFPVRKSNSRSVAEPPTTSVIKGPREGFVEDLKTNMVLLRRKLRSNKLIFERSTMGSLSATAVCITYIKGIVPKKTVEKVKNRLADIEIDGIMDSSYVAKILEERPYSLFKQIGNSEKVDVIASRLLDGRVAILVDGSPIVLTVPYILIEDFEDNQDRYKMASLVTFSHIVRLFGVFFALLLPAAFVAVQSHQYQILPLQLMITVLNATGGIPFSPTLEMIIALLLFEILTEASIRMPKHVGMALSVVGAIVLGQTAMEAGFLSSITVLIVAMSGIGIYTVPDQAGVIGCLRIILVVAAGLLGIYGVLVVLLALFAYLSELSHFDVPYLSPFAPIENDDLKNAIVKESLTDRYKRPFFSSENQTRMKNRRQL